jgi:isoquinoline 1-oxidoreductase subunit beta
MSTFFRVTRRDFLRSAGLSAGALMFGSYFGGDEAKGASLEELKQVLHNFVPLAAFAAIEPLDGTIVILTHRPEMGQGTRSTLAAVLADELEADWSRVKLKIPEANSEAFAVEFPVEVLPSVKLPFPYSNLNPKTKESPQYLIVPEASQFADSSRSVTIYYAIMRLTGAGIRLVFERAAAKVMGVPANECHAQQHKVIHKPSGRSLDFGNTLLLVEAGKIGKDSPPAYNEIVAALKKPSEWRYINKETMPFVDAPDMVKGKAVYGADVDLPGMLTAMIERCPVANGTLVSFDPAPALAVPGVRKVMPVLPQGWPAGGVGMAFLPHAGVAVIADNTWAAWQGRRALKPTIKWDLGPNASYDSTAYRANLEKSTSSPGTVVRKKGNVDSAFGGAGKVVEAGYYVPLLAQTPMEPPVAVAVVKNGKVEVWAPTQNPEAAQQMAGFFGLGIPPTMTPSRELLEKIHKNVTLHLTLLGGGFGRKSKPDYVAEAASLAAQNPGVPIRVQWTREDDVKFSYYNAVSSQYLKAALDGDGKPTALLQRSALTSFFATLFPDTPDGAVLRANTYGGGKYPYASGIERAQGLEDMPFEVANVTIENCPAPNHVRVGWMRSVANIYHAFGICSFADEMAIAAGRDSKDYLLELIGKGRVLPLTSEGVAEYRNNELPLETISVPINGTGTPLVSGYPPDTRRLRTIIERVAKESNWDQRVKQYKGMKGRGLGIAAHRSFLSYVAIVADVSLNDKNELTVNEVWGVIDCGLAVNPDRVRAQMEGGINYGLSYALLGEITCKNGAVEQNNFDDYPVLRIYQTPKKINVYIMDSDQPPSGVGEPPTPAVAPAIANAIVAAGGPRIREIPFLRQVTVL